MFTDMDNDNVITFRPERRQFLADNLLMVVLLIILMILPGLDGVLPDYTRTPVLVLALIILAVLACRYLALRVLRYEITDEQLAYRHGILAISQDYVELYRVTDYVEKRSFMQVILGLKTVCVLSGDQTTPKLDLTGLPARMDVVSELRKRVEYNKKKKGVYEITNR